MRKITIDGEVLKTRNSIHQHLKTDLGFPDYYGMNLDALYDVLITEERETEIRIANEDKLTSNIGEYWNRLSDTLTDISLQNKKITISMVPSVNDIREAGRNANETQVSSWVDKLRDSIIFQGSLNHINYFEGWYFKQVSIS